MFGLASGTGINILIYLLILEDLNYSANLSYRNKAFSLDYIIKNAFRFISCHKKLLLKKRFISSKFARNIGSSRYLGQASSYGSHIRRGK